MGNSSTHNMNTDITYTGSNTDKNNSWKETTAQITFDAWNINVDAWQVFLDAS